MWDKQFQDESEDITDDEVPDQELIQMWKKWLKCWEMNISWLSGRLQRNWTWIEKLWVALTEDVDMNKNCTKMVGKNLPAAWTKWEEFAQMFQENCWNLTFWKKYWLVMRLWSSTMTQKPMLWNVHSHRVSRLCLSFGWLHLQLWVIILKIMYEAVNSVSSSNWVGQDSRSNWS